MTAPEVLSHGPVAELQMSKILGQDRLQCKKPLAKLAD